MVAPAGTPGRKGADKAAAGGGASMSAADTQGMLAAIHQAAAPAADQLVHDRQVARMPYQGPGAAVLPAMSQVVVAGGHCYITLHSAPRPRHSTPGKGLSQQQQQQQPSSSAGHAAVPDYEAESAALLAELQRLLQHSGSGKRWLIKVRVTLRSMQEGLPGFQAAWNAWAPRDGLPVMTLVEGAGPFKAAGLMLEATALVEA
ncbi:hypothetical protein COO60DRAFT_1624702 [Scenedesmus sp. NREL 46B-D3]|nr:hypothetical protein COO60DRAFT_1624702 [Scenedesmus sp. NREL 46B-D3]